MSSSWESKTPSRDPKASGHGRHGRESRTDSYSGEEVWTITAAPLRSRARATRWPFGTCPVPGAVGYPTAVTPRRNFVCVDTCCRPVRGSLHFGTKRGFHVQGVPHHLRRDRNMCGHACCINIRKRIGQQVTIQTSKPPGPVSGTFSATGAFADDGTINNLSIGFSALGAPTFGITHVTVLFTGDDGTFTLKAQIKETLTADPQVLTDSGTWTIIAGTGAYADLHGQGTISGTVNDQHPPDLPDVRRRRAFRLIRRGRRSPGAHRATERQGTLWLEGAQRARPVAESLPPQPPPCPGRSKTDGLDLPAGGGHRDRAATPEEATELLEALPEEQRPLWATAFYGGLRRGELRALRWRNVHGLFSTEPVRIRVEASWDDFAGEDRAQVPEGNPLGPGAGVLRPYLEAQATRRISVEAIAGDGGDDLVFSRTADSGFTTSHVRRSALKAWAAENERRVTEAKEHDQPKPPLLTSITLPRVPSYLRLTDARSGRSAGAHR